MTIEAMNRALEITEELENLEKAVAFARRVLENPRALVLRNPAQGEALRLKMLSEQATTSIVATIIGDIVVQQAKLQDELDRL